MKQPMWGVVAAAVASAIVVVALQAQEHRLAKAPPQPSTQAAEEKGEVVFTFPDEAAMQTFATQWQQRQAMMARMAVLQDYWKQEQANLAQLNQQLLTDYHLDVSKAYTLDRDKRVLIERAPNADATAASPEAPPPVTPTP
jgi:hypothetical protein